MSTHFEILILSYLDVFDMLFREIVVFTSSNFLLSIPTEGGHCLEIYAMFLFFSFQLV